MNSLFQLLREQGMTTLTISYDHKSDKFRYFAAKEWNEDINFSEYNHTFHARTLLCEDAVYCNTEKFLRLCDENEMSEYLDTIKQLMRSGKHEAIRMYYYKKYNAKFASFEHSCKRALKNKRHAIVCGGIRRHLPDVPELEVVTDGLNLGRAMAFKNLAAQIPFGGCKITLQVDEMDLRNDELLGFIGYATDQVRAVTAPDMNVPTELSDIMGAKGYSHQYVGGKNSCTGTTGKPTAYGVYLSLKEAVRFFEGVNTLENKKILLIGLGAVGWNMGEYFLSENARLTICDINQERVKSFLDTHAAQKIEWTAPERAFSGNYDIISPCAAGGIFDENVIRNLKCRYIWGSANNQLKATSKEDEIRLAKMLLEKDIAYQIEWWHNTAGVICMAEEYLSESSQEELMKKVEIIIPSATRSLLAEAKKNKLTPTECAYRRCETEIYNL